MRLLQANAWARRAKAWERRSGDAWDRAGQGRSGVLIIVNKFNALSSHGAGPGCQVNRIPPGPTTTEREYYDSEEASIQRAQNFGKRIASRDRKGIWVPARYSLNRAHAL